MLKNRVHDTLKKAVAGVLLIFAALGKLCAVNLRVVFIHYLCWFSFPVFFFEILVKLLSRELHLFCS